MVLQVPLYHMDLIRSRWPEPSLVIDKDHQCILEMRDHVWKMVAVHIHKAQCHRGQIRTWAVQLWPQVDTSMGAIATRKFDDLQVSAEIQRDEMARAGL